MGFKRIEWIFFIAFLGVNIFLINIYIGSRNDQSIITTSSQKIAIEQRLENDDITYDGTLSSVSETGYYLSGTATTMQSLYNENATDNKKLLNDGTTTFDGTKLTHTLSEYFLVKDKEQLAKASQTYWKKRVMNGSDYTYQVHFSTIGENQVELTATQSYEGIPINDSSSQLVFSFTSENGQYVNKNYTQTYVANLTPLREKMTLYSEKDAINTLYINNRIAKKATIEWIQLAYTLILNVRGQNVYVPAWFVSIEKADKSTQTEIVNAFSNRIITNASVRKVENY